MTRLEPSSAPTATPSGDPTKPKEPDKSLGELFSELADEFSDLTHTQIELAKTEIRNEAAKAGRVAGMFGGAALAGYMALLLLSFAAAWGLANVMNEGWAFLIVGVVYAIVGGLLYLRARTQARDVNLVPEGTVESIKEDVQWARQKMR
jgi:uncharacterized membrane protein YqjE